MTSIVSILTIIDDLIKRTDKVKVCQHHLQVIATSLTRLQRGLNTTNATLKVGTRSLEDIGQTLKAINEVVITCTDNEADLKGITYRDLESVLLRLQLRLAQHEVNLTDDYETKVQILSNAYYEQQILVQKVFDKTIKQRLETIEQYTKENTIEQLRLLREKHFNTIKAYLQDCTEQHKSVPLIGLTGDIVAKVAHSFYQISSEDQAQLEQNWQSCELPLTRTFIQFKPDKSTSFERNESRRLLIGSDISMLQGPHSRKEVSKGISERLVSAPHMMSMMERDRYSTEEDDVSEENIIRTKRWIVILGDPGSGKTSFARWLVRHLAQTLLLNGQHSTDYGPLRIPILIRVGEFAEMLSEQPSLTLFDYIGKHKWMGKSLVNDPFISLNNLSSALQDYIKQGQALIILDGLDEIPVSNQRSKIINVVENFVDTYVQTPTRSSAFDNPHLNRLFDDPSQSGGNQLIVTSRIVGYHAAPLAGQFAHFTIRPMNLEHMKDFVDYWFFRVHQRILDTLNLSSSNLGENHGEALKKELMKTENVGLLDVASNSCLMSFICSVAFSQLDGSPLPTQRIRLYEQIVNSMLSLWSSKRSTIPIPELIRILSDIATYIHENSASGLIHEDKMKEVCIQSIKDSLNKNVYTDEDGHRIGDQASEFVRIIREAVGILAARGESLYGFLHLTFQEYFTCLKLIDIDTAKQEKDESNGSCLQNRVQLVAQLLRYRANDPRFRIPLALALGKISSTWSQTDFDAFCYEFIQEQDGFDSILPLGAYTLITCLDDLVNYPSNDVLFDTFDLLMIAAGRHKWSVVCPFLFDQIRAALRKFRNDIIPLWINKLLLRSPSHDIQTISALCHLIEGTSHEFENIKWLNQSSCSMFQCLSLLDSEHNEFAIDRILVKIAFSNHRLLPVDSTTFKGFLLGEEIELNSIPVALFPLIVTLYGGLKRDDQVVVFNPLHIHRESTAVTPILLRFLSRKRRDKEDDDDVMIFKQECLRSLMIQIENHGESCETVDLCIATICLYGIDYVRDNVKMISSSLVCMSMNRLKYMTMILRQFYFIDGENNILDPRKITNFISSVIENFQHTESSKVRFLDLLDSLRSSAARLKSSATSIFVEGRSNSYERLTLYLPNSLLKENKFLNHLLSTDIDIYPDRMSCSLLHNFTKLFWILENNDEHATQYRMAVALDTIPEYLLFRNDEDLLSPFIFIPQHLRNLYLRLVEQRFIVINPKDLIDDNRPCLSFEHILLECLMVISNASCKRLSLLAALIALLPYLRMYRLENFGSSLLWILATKDQNYLNTFETAKLRPMNYETGVYMNRLDYFPVENPLEEEERRKLIEKCIEQEHQRLQDALSKSDGTSTKIYSACVSLARVCRWSHDKNRLYLLEESVQGAMSINNKLIRLDALCMIAFYSHSDYDHIQVDRKRSLQEEIDYQLQDVYPDLPLLLHTAIFIRCLPLLQDQETVTKCLQNLFSKFTDVDQRDQQVVYEALSPYLQSNPIFSSRLEHISNSIVGYHAGMKNKSSVFKEYLNIKTNENLSSSLLLSNLYLAELVGDFSDCVASHDLRCLVSYSDHHTIDKPLSYTLFQFESSILTTTQVLAITNILSFGSLSTQFERPENLYFFLSNALHRVNVVEFKTCRILESWMKWKDSNKLASFAYHAALLLVNSNLWSVEAATIVCDLLCNENDRFRQRAETILRLESCDDILTSSKLGINVLLNLCKKKAECELTSPTANLTLLRVFENLTLDCRSHLSTLLWLERYRLYVMVNKEYTFDNSKLSPLSHVALCFSENVMTDVSFCDSIRHMSDDLMQYICDLIISNFSSFLEIDGDTTSNAVVESHVQFVVLVLISVGKLYNNSTEARALAVDAITTLLERSTSNEIRGAAVYALGYICNETTYKILFDQLQAAINNEAIETSNYSEGVVVRLVSSYCHCIAIREIDFKQDDIDLFRKLLKHSSQNILKATCVGLGQVLKDKSLLLEMLGSDYIQCYHALIGATAYLVIYNPWESSVDAAAQFIEEHPDLLPIVVVELYNSIRHFTKDVLYDITVDYYLAYGYPRYAEVAASIAVRIPATFCAYIKDWHDGDNLKQALFYASKQHDFSRRAVCLTLLSVFGELTVELCEMIIEGLRDDPYIQNICYKCLTRINSIKDETVVMNLLLSYLKSKSMNVRYVAAKILLHLSKSSIISSNQVQTVLNDLMLNPSSQEDLWLIEEQDDVVAACRYFYAGPLKDVIYSLLVQHLTGDASGIIRRNELNDIDADFVESEKASRLASCLYEKKTEEHSEIEITAKSMPDD